MNICYLCADLGIPVGGHKGASAHVRSMVSAFKELGHSVTVVTSGGEPSGIGGSVIHVPKQKIREAIAGHVEARLHRALRHLWNNAAVEETLARTLEAEYPDLVYERYSPFGVAGALIAHTLGIPHVLEVNAPLAREGAQYRRQALTDAATALEQSTFSATRLIRCVSSQLREELIEAGVVPEKIVVVPNGVDSGLFCVDGPRYSDSLEGKFVIGFVGSLKPWHGIETLAAAFRILAQNAHFHLLVVGDGPMAKALEPLRDERPGQVTLMRAVPHADVPFYVRAMDVAVAPYPPLERFYFSPLKVLEYMAAGRAVVASRIGQLEEMIDHGRTGLLVPPGDAKALAEAVRSIADQPAHGRRLGERAAQHARARHSWTQRAALILDRARALA